MVVEMKMDDNQILVTCPYNIIFKKKARYLNGFWDRKKQVWIFPASRKTFVQNALDEVFGTDGSYPATMLTVRIVLDSYPAAENARTIYFGGFPLVFRYSRDTEVKIYPWAYVIQGNFEESGGSRNYPVVTWEKGTVLCAELPLAAYENEEKKDGIFIDVDKKALKYEKKRLKKRLKKIEKIKK